MLTHMYCSVGQGGTVISYCEKVTVIIVMSGKEIL